MPTPPLSVHFVNNALAAAAGLVDEDADAARDVLARLGAFLSYRLREPRPVTLADELDHVGVYLALEQARFPGRVEAEVPDAAPLRAPATPGCVQAPLAEALARWLGRREGRVRVALRVRPDGAGIDVQLDAPDHPDAPGERVRIPLRAPEAA